jgi:nucleoside-diphosphate-sugar epimerase
MTDTTLVIGAGLVGSQIGRVLQERDERVVFMDPAPQPDSVAQILDISRAPIVPGSVLRPLELTRVIREHGITRIVHTAANPMLTLGAQRDPYAAIELNVMGTVNVLEAARIHGIARVVVASSNVLNHYIAGGRDAPGALIGEEDYPRPTTFYASTKQAVENLGLNYASWCGVEFAAVRYGAVCGPWSGAGGGGPSNVFRTAVRAALAGHEAMVPPAAMEWVYSKDAGRGTVLALEARDLCSRVFNITMGRLVTPQDMCDALVAAIPGAKVRLENPAGTAVSLQQMMRRSDPTLARDVLGYEPEFDIFGAVADMVRFEQVRQQAG